MSSNVDVVRRLLAAVEERDLQAMLDCYDDDVEINESGSLPYGGVYRGREGVMRHARAFVATWSPYQTETEHSLGAVFGETEDGTVVAVFRHRAVDPVRGHRLDGPEVGLYDVRGDRVVRSRMFHFDPTEVTGFLDAALRPSST